MSARKTTIDNECVSENKLKGFDIRKAKCPFCGGEINRYWFEDVYADYAYFVVECYKPVYMKKEYEVSYL